MRRTGVRLSTPPNRVILRAQIQRRMSNEENHRNEKGRVGSQFIACPRTIIALLSSCLAHLYNVALFLYEKDVVAPLTR